MSSSPLRPPEAERGEGVPRGAGALLRQEAGGRPGGVLQQPAGQPLCGLCAHLRSASHARTLARAITRSLAHSLNRALAQSLRVHSH